jgi:glycosyltransferase involved in cell wall biosynthesis
VADVRVLHVLPTSASEYGGPVRVAEAFCEQLIRGGHEAEIFAAATTRASRHLAYWPGLPALRALQTKLQTLDLVHVHGLWNVPASAAALEARRSNLPFVITPHGMLDRWSLRHHSTRKKLYAALLERRNLDAAAAIHFFNDEERDEAREFGIRAPTFVLPNGVDLERFESLPGREALWRQYPNLAHRTLILFLGRLHPKKGLPLLIDALARLTAQRRDVHLLVAGPDESGHRAQLEASVRRHRLQEHVLFTGAVAGEQKRLLLGSADLFVLPSHQEGDSVAVKEALAAGLPVVITGPCHFRQVAEAAAGIVVQPVVEEIHAALERLCGDEALRKRMAGNARPLVERDFRWDRLGRELVQHYRDVLARHRGQPLAAAVGGR